MLGRSTSYTARGLTTPRPGAFSGRRPRSLLARAFARNSPLRHMDWLLIVVVILFAIAWLAARYYGYHFVPNWPLFVK